MAWREKIGALVRQARLEAGLKQEALAERIGVAPLSVSHIENGRQAPKVETLERIAQATNKPLAWFFQEPAAAPLDRLAAEEAPPPPEPPVTPDLAASSSARWARATCGSRCLARRRSATLRQSSPQ